MTTTPTTNVLITSALEYLRAQAPRSFLNVDVPLLETGLQRALDAIIPRDVGLTTYQPDYESVLLQLMQALQTDNAWRETITAGTGQTLLRNIASGLSALHVALVRATQENFGHLAQGDNAVLANTRFLGVNPRRRTSAQVAVRLTAEDYSGVFEIPAMSAWDVAGAAYFNRERVAFGEFDLTQTVTLFEGAVYTATVVAEGTPFERITIGNNNGAISATDIVVRVNGVLWERVERMWTASQTQLAWRERTDGRNVTLQFGDGVYGARLPAGATVDIQWAEPTGAAVASVPLGTAVRAPFVDIAVNLAGVTVTPAFGGDDAVPTTVYRVMAPHIRAAEKTAINRANFRAVAIEYPGVADAYFRGQAELNPNKRSWMNIVSATILTRRGTPFNTYERADFLTWMRERAIENLEFIWADPIAVPVNLRADVFCNREANLGTTKAVLEADLRAAFAPRLGSLGYSYYASDIGTILEGTTSPTDPQIHRVIEYATNVVLDNATNGDLIMPNTRYYAQLGVATLNMDYTARGEFSGRKDVL